MAEAEPSGASKSADLQEVQEPEQHEGVAAPEATSGSRKRRATRVSIPAMVIIFIAVLLPLFLVLTTPDSHRRHDPHTSTSRDAIKAGDGHNGAALTDSVADFFAAAGNFRCPQSRLFTVEEVARHSTEYDLWIVIDSNVLDVSAFIRQHPGGAVLLEGAGGDDMATVFSQFHHTSSVTLFSSFCLGRLRTDHSS